MTVYTVLDLKDEHVEVFATLEDAFEVVKTHWQRLSVMGNPTEQLTVKGLYESLAAKPTGVYLMEAQYGSVAKIQKHR